MDEVVAITHNFAPEEVLDGSTGIFKLGDEIVVDANTNLIAAYKEGMGRIKPGALKTSDIVNLRSKGFNIITDGKDLKNVPLRAKTSAAILHDPLHPEVKEKLLKYGYTVEEHDGITKIGYSQSWRGPPPLDQFVTRLNELVKLRYPPEYIASYAMQELLIIHPFQDGNGRTARLLGQIIYKKLTGVDFIFPPSFKKEMGYSVARKHAEKLRGLVFFLLAAALLVLLVSLAAPVVSLLAAVLTVAAAVVERWLFFAQAQHIVSLYYGAKAA